MPRVRREAAERLRGPARTDAPRVRRPAWAAERLREADAPRVPRPAGGLRGLRGPMPRVWRREAAERLPGRRTSAGDRCPVCAACGGRPRNACGGLRGPRSRVCGDLRGPRNACGRPMPRVCRGLREACGGCEDRGPACTAARGTPAGGPCPARGGGLREACGMSAGGRGPACAAACEMPAGGRCPARGGGLLEACRTPAGGRCPRRTTQGGRIQRPPKRLSSPLPGACRPRVRRAFGPPGPSACVSGGMRGVSG